MIERKSTLDQLEIDKTGYVKARFALQLVEDGNVLNQAYHRAMFDVNVANSVILTMYEVNRHLVEMMGVPPIPQEDIDLMVAHVALHKTLMPQPAP